MDVSEEHSIGRYASAKAIEDKNGGNPMRAEDAGAVRSASINLAIGVFRDLLKAARMYAFNVGAGPKSTIGLEKIGHDIVAPGSHNSVRMHFARLSTTFSEPFKKVDDFYKGKEFPKTSTFLIRLHVISAFCVIA